MRLLGLDREDLDAFLEAVHAADLVVVSGQGSFNDTFRGHALDTLDLLGLAHRIGTPTALFGQGVGPVEDPRLRERMVAVLPRVELIALREGRSGPRLLRSLQVSAERVRTTGDDAIELAYSARPERLGRGLGLNLRVSEYSQVGGRLLEGIRAILPRVCERYGASVIPLPISVQEPASDAETLRQLLAGLDGTTDEGPEPDTPLQVIELAGRCRVIVTGSYHAAVFALSQGVPAVCLALSAYYRQKFLGLADQFRGGCEVITVETSQLCAQLDAAIDRAWWSAERMRGSLLAAAARQVGLSRSAYCLVHEQIQARTARRAAPSRRARVRMQAQADGVPPRREQSRSNLESADTFPR
jgi:colanic acid/amylovoran biosynthesis protein